VAYGSRDPNAGGGTAVAQPISRAFALTVLVALLILVALRHLFGSIRLEGGVR
jgi:hypothetical protein